MKIASLTIEQIREGLTKKRFSAAELATEALANAKAVNGETNALLTFADERALAETISRLRSASATNSDSDGM